MLIVQLLVALGMMVMATVCMCGSMFIMFAESKDNTHAITDGHNNAN